MRRSLRSGCGLMWMGVEGGRASCELRMMFGGARHCDGSNPLHAQFVRDPTHHTNNPHNGVVAGWDFISLLMISMGRARGG